MSEGSRRASRLVPPRWLDVRLVLGMVLVLLAVVGGSRVFASAGHFTKVYVARQALVPGEQLAAGDLSIGEVRFNGEGSSYVAVAGRAPVGYLVTRYVDAGEFVPLSALSATTSTVGDSRFVTVPVGPGHLPDGLHHGDLVDVYVTAKVTAGAKVPFPTRVLAAVAVDSADGGSESSAGSTVAVVLDVPAALVATMVHAVESGTIDLVRVPPSAAAPVPVPVPTSSATP